MIELLVVIAIISLLVSILLPSLNKAKALARTVICVSDTRLIGMAMTLYVEENGYYPPLVGQNIYPPTGESTNSPWFYLLDEQMPGQAGYSATTGAGPRFLICPEAPEHEGHGYLDVGYGYNYKTFAYGRGTPQQSANPGGSSYIDMAKVTQDMVLHPSEKILIGDGRMGWYPAGMHPTYGIDWPGNGITPDNRRDISPTQRHNGWTIANLGYADGHAATDGKATFDGTDEGKTWDYEHWSMNANYGYAW